MTTAANIKYISKAHRTSTASRGACVGRFFMVSIGSLDSVEYGNIVDTQNLHLQAIDYGDDIAGDDIVSISRTPKVYSLEHFNRVIHFSHQPSEKSYNQKQLLTLSSGSQTA